MENTIWFLLIYRDAQQRLVCRGLRPHRLSAEVPTEDAVAIPLETNLSINDVSIYQADVESLFAKTTAEFRYLNSFNITICGKHPYELPWRMFAVYEHNTTAARLLYADILNYAQSHAAQED